MRPLAFAPAALPAVIEHHPYVDSGHSDDATSADLSPLNELLDRIAALGLSSPGDPIGSKSGHDEIDPSPITRLVAAVEDGAIETSPLETETVIVRISEPFEPNMPLSAATLCSLSSGTDTRTENY